MVGDKIRTMLEEEIKDTERVKIIQIAVAMRNFEDHGQRSEVILYGLGDDGYVYQQDRDVRQIAAGGVYCYGPPYWRKLAMGFERLTA
jgi:hypothetical protein